MQIKRTETVPASTREVVDRCVCDLCGAKTELNGRWPGQHGNAAETTIEMKQGDSWGSDGGDVTMTSFDICIGCFTTKLVPCRANRDRRIAVPPAMTRRSKHLLRPEGFEHKKGPKMDRVTPDQVRAAVSEAGVEMWQLRECSICATPLHYLFCGDAVTYDAGCACSGYREPPQIRSWSDISETLNIQTPEWRAKMWAEMLGTKPK